MFKFNAMIFSFIMFYFLLVLKICFFLKRDRKVVDSNGSGKVELLLVEKVAIVISVYFMRKIFNEKEKENIVYLYNRILQSF